MRSHRWFARGIVALGVVWAGSWTGDARAQTEPESGSSVTVVTGEHALDFSLVPSEAEALAECKKLASENPRARIRCAYNGKVILDQAGSPAVDADVPSPIPVTRAAKYRAFRNGVLYDEIPELPANEALARCREEVKRTPKAKVLCTHGGRFLHQSKAALKTSYKALLGGREFKSARQLSFDEALKDCESIAVNHNSAKTTCTFTATIELTAK